MKGCQFAYGYFIMFIILHLCGKIVLFEILVDAAKEALTDMPPRSEEELDVVTLHNVALMNMDGGPTQGFEKLQFLLQQNPFPHETFGNLLLLYLKYEYYDLAADVLAENAHLTYKFLTPVRVVFCSIIVYCIAISSVDR